MIESTLKKTGWILWLWTILLLSWCTTESSLPNFSHTNIVNCDNEKEGDKWICAENVIQKISNDWIKKCIEFNIWENADLTSKMNNDNIQKNDLEIIDWLIKECRYYHDSEVVKTKNTSNVPVFEILAWSYLTNSWYRGLNDYNTHTPTNVDKYYEPSKEKNNNWTIVWKTTTTKNWTDISKAWWSNAWIDWVENQYKKSTWNIKSMKNASNTMSNYKIGNTWKTWSTITSKSSSYKGSWSSSSKSSSFKSSSSSSRSSLW